MRNARVGDFGGKNLGTISSTVLRSVITGHGNNYGVINDTVIVRLSPNHARTVQLMQWYRDAGAQQQAHPLSGGARGGGGDRRCTLSAIADEALGQGDKPDYIVVDAATITEIKIGEALKKDSKLSHTRLLV